MDIAVTKMVRLGKLNFDNQENFFELFDELPEELTLVEAEALLGIFEEEDDDDYSAFVWDLIMRLEKVKGLLNSETLINSKVYWVGILKVALERQAEDLRL